MSVLAFDVFSPRVRENGTDRCRCRSDSPQRVAASFRTEWQRRRTTIVRTPRRDADNFRRRNRPRRELRAALKALLRSGRCDHRNGLQTRRHRDSRACRAPPKSSDLPRARNSRLSCSGVRPGEPDKPRTSAAKEYRRDKPRRKSSCIANRAGGCARPGSRRGATPPGGRGRCLDLPRPRSLGRGTGRRSRRSDGLLTLHRGQRLPRLQPQTSNS